MIYEAFTDSLPIYFYIPVLAITALYIIYHLICFIWMHVKVSRITKELSGIESGISMEQGCQIENLPLISEAFESASHDAASAFKEMLQSSADYYHKRWIPDPAEYITPVTVSDKSLKRHLNKDGLYVPLFIGLTITFLSFFAGLMLIKDIELISLVLWLSLLPFFFTILISIAKVILYNKNSHKLSLSIKALNGSISRKVPVFSDNAGVSLLVSQFIEYDRNMASSVETLAEKIDRFTSEELITAVSSSIEDTLRGDVFPSLERSNEAILALAKDISDREDEGMKALAVNFASSVTSELSYHLKPISAQIENLVHTLSDSKNFVDVIASNVKIYKQNAEEMHALTAQTLKDYEQSREGFENNIASIASSVKEFDSINKDFTERISGDIRSFETAVETLKNKMEESDKTLKVMLDAIFVEARTSEENAGKALESASSYIYSMNDQISKMTSDLSEQNTSMLEKLDTLLNDFFSRQKDQMDTRESGLSEKTAQMLNSMEESAEIIRKSTVQIKEGFDQLEEARRLEEEARAKKSIFRRKK